MFGGQTIYPSVNLFDIMHCLLYLLPVKLYTKAALEAWGRFQYEGDKRLKATVETKTSFSFSFKGWCVRVGPWTLSTYFHF